MPTIRQPKPAGNTVKVTINSQQSTGITPHTLGLNLKWSAKAQKHINDVLAQYPADRSRSALIPLLHLAQREFGGWLSVDAMQLVADTLNLPYIRVYEVATFYTMFNLAPVGTYHVQVCTNCSCMVRGSDAVVAAVKEFTGIAASGATSADGTFTFTEVECLGACVAAPMMQIAAAQSGAMHYYTNLDAARTRQILKHLKDGGDMADFADTPPAAVDPIHNDSYGS